MYVGGIDFGVMLRAITHITKKSITQKHHTGPERRAAVKVMKGRVTS